MERSPTTVRQSALGLGALFGTMYFVQGIAEPTEGLIAQPVRALLKTWGHSAAEIGLFAAVLALPWSFKPLYGLISDFVPLAGYRRRSYLLLATAVTVLGLATLAIYPPSQGQTVLLLVALLLPTTAVAFSDVVVDALMVEKGQPSGTTGTLQAVQWAALYSATIVAGVLGGWLSASARPAWGFAICAALTTTTLLLAWMVVDEQPVLTRPPRGAALRSLREAMATPGLAAVAAFLFLWNFNPFSSSVLYLYFTGELGFGEQFYGNLVALDAVGAVAASVAYGWYCRRVGFTRLVHLSIALGVAATLAYWLVIGPRSAVAATAAVGFIYMTACLVQYDLAARVCPAATAATVFAVLMGTTNLANLLSTAVGSYLYEQALRQWGATLAFNGLVAIGAVFTAGCWLLVPALSRATARRGP